MIGDFLKAPWLAFGVNQVLSSLKNARHKKYKVVWQQHNSFANQNSQKIGNPLGDGQVS